MEQESTPLLGIRTVLHKPEAIGSSLVLEGGKALELQRALVKFGEDCDIRGIATSILHFLSFHPLRKLLELHTSLYKPTQPDELYVTVNGIRKSILECLKIFVFALNKKLVVSNGTAVSELPANLFISTYPFMSLVRTMRGPESESFSWLDRGLPLTKSFQVVTVQYVRPENGNIPWVRIHGRWVSLETSEYFRITQLHSTGKTMFGINHDLDREALYIHF